MLLVLIFSIRSHRKKKKSTHFRMLQAFGSESFKPGLGVDRERDRLTLIRMPHAAQ